MSNIDQIFGLLQAARQELLPTNEQHHQVLDAYQQQVTSEAATTDGSIASSDEARINEARDIVAGVTSGLAQLCIDAPFPDPDFPSDAVKFDVEAEHLEDSGLNAIYTEAGYTFHYFGWFKTDNTRFLARLATLSSGPHYNGDPTPTEQASRNRAAITMSQKSIVRHCT